MEKMCVGSLMCDRGESEEDGRGGKVICANGQENSSPAVKTIIHSKKSKFIPYADDDIPSYQIVHGSKRFSDMSEEQDSILPISPVITPPRIKKQDNFQVPFVPTIGTIVKKNSSYKVALHENAEEVPSKESTKKCKSAYEVLGMVDNDISWNSSMETPTHKLLPLGDYNTIERATLLPEKDLQNMQPRVLFSPHENDDSECVPLKYSSESEDEKDIYSQKVTSPSLCEINLKTQTSNSDSIKSTAKNEKSPKTLMPDDGFIKSSGLSPISPVFRVNRKKTKTKKPKSLLVKSPEIVTGNSVKNSNSESNLCETKQKVISNTDLSCEVLVTEIKETKNDSNLCINEMSDTFQDDSLQNISFSCFADELCNTSDFASDSNVTHTNVNVNNFPCAKKEADFRRNDNEKYNSEKNLSSAQEKITNSNKFFFYDSSRTDELHPVLSLDDFLQSAKQFETEEPGVIATNKPCETFNDSELTVFNKMISHEISGQGLKRIRPVSHTSPDPYLKKKKMEISNKFEAIPECTETQGGRMEVEQVKKQNSTQGKATESGGNGNKKCMTTICRERLVDNKKKVTSCETSSIGVNEQTDNDQMINKYKENRVNNGAGTGTASVTTLGKPVQFSHGLDAFNCNENFKTELDNNMENSWEMGDFQGFKTASGIPVKISENSLNKAKKLFLEPDVDTLSPKFPEHVGFSTASGAKVQISEESLKKAKNLFCDLDGNEFNETEEAMAEVTETEPLGFKTASNKSIKVSEESLKRAQELWKQIEDIPVEKSSVLPHNTEPKGNISKEKTIAVPVVAGESCPRGKTDSAFCGFMTASGNSVTISENALKKARKMLTEEIPDPGEEIIPEKAAPVAKACPKECSDTVVNDRESTVSRDIAEGDSESSELIPPWLHAYNTSPTFTTESTQLNSGTSYEGCSRNSTPRERYLIKSPVLGKTDRFFNRGKRRRGKKLLFKSPSKDLSNEDETGPDSARIKAPSIKRDSSELGVDFAVPFKKQKIKEGDEDASIRGTKLSFEVMDGREKARQEQVEARTKSKVNPVKGSHILKKKQKQMRWADAVRGTFPGRYSGETLKDLGVRDDVLQVTSTNAHNYRFQAQHFFTCSACLSNINGFPVGDDCLLIFDDDNTAGVEEVTRAFFASPGVEPKLISPEWVKNHYRWIVWKLSHYERSFPHVFGGNCLTPHNVMAQLKYRYDREIDGSERSALKKILERDESSRKRMVLCVSDIKKSSDLYNRDIESSHNGVVSYVLELSDGWYGCCAQTDSAMSRLIEEGKVTIGTKLITHGAELLVSEGVSPLEVSDKVYLKIFTNSTRRVKWDTKLGFQKNDGPLLVSLNSLFPNGGPVGRLDVVIVRIYPVLFMEKRSDGTHVVRNSRSEDKAALAYQEQQEAVFEKIYQQVRDEIQSRAKEKEKSVQKVTLSDVSKITDAKELFRLYEGCSDPSSFQNLLTPEQKDILVKYQLRKKQITDKELSDMVQEKIKVQKMNVRRVTQLLRVKIVDLHKSDYDNPVLLTIWNSTEDVSQMLSEGKALSIFNTVSSNSRFHKPVQLNSTRYTQYKELAKIVKYPARKLSSLSELTPDYEPVLNEIDVVGVVAFIREMSYGSKLSQTIYLADSEYNFIGLVFWGSCKNLGWENVLTVSSVVACSNLQWGSKRSFGGIPNVYVTDSSVFKENPRENYLKEGIKALKSSLPEDMKKFIGKCEDEIIAKLDEERLSNVSRNTCDSSNSSATAIKPKYVNGFKMKPNASSTPLKSRVFGLDTSDQEPSPIQKRIEKLLMYGEPPPLSPLLSLENSGKFNAKFKPPSKNVVDSSAK